MFYLFIYLLVSVLVFAEEDSLFEDFNDNLNITVASNNITITNTTDNFQNITMERIVTPSGSLTFDENSSNQPSRITLNSTKDGRDFRPSPHLGTYYDFSILPPSPEAKHSSSYDLDKSGRISWTDSIKLTTESNWGNTKIKFPTQKPEVVASNDHPYPFVRDESISEKNGGVTTYEYIAVTNNNQPDRTYYEFPNLAEEAQRPYLNGVVHNNFALQGKSGFLDRIPWNKVVKFLTTAIPIGLLIGALTPNVINVSSVNATQGRARLDENESRTRMQLIYSSKLIDELQKRDCRRRILCELLLSAGLSKNGEEYAKNFLDLFMQQETDMQEKTNELRKMLDAVRKENCKEFRCESRNKKPYVN